MPLLYLAIVLRPVSVQFKQSTTIFALIYALAALLALSIGLGMRLLLVDRRRQAAALRLEQRTEFARDLHDFVAHHVTGIVVQAQGAHAIADRRPDLVPPALQRIEQAGSEALTSMRHMVGMLRDADGEVALTPLAGIGEVRSLVEEFSAVGGARAELELKGPFEDLPVEVTTTAHRVVMEALTNVRKHAHGCSEVRVRVERSGDRVLVRVSDDGRPRPASRSGFGLKGLAERVGLIGGSVEAGPVTAGGWGVEAALPVAPAGWRRRTDDPGPRPAVCCWPGGPGRVPVAGEGIRVPAAVPAGRVLAAGQASRSAKTAKPAASRPAAARRASRPRLPPPRAPRTGGRSGRSARAGRRTAASTPAGPGSSRPSPAPSSVRAPPRRRRPARRRPASPSGASTGSSSPTG